MRRLMRTLAMICMVAETAHAEESPYCRRVEAQAAADAAVLRGPRVFLEGIRFPSSNRLDLGPTVGNNLQGRLGLAFSPVDWLRGGAVHDAAEADCTARRAADRLEDLLPSLDDVVRLDALRAEAAYLKGHQPEWESLVAKSVKRFDARLITVVEMHEVRARAAELERKLVQVRGEARRLEINAMPANEWPPSLDAVAAGYVSSEGALDQALAKLRRLDAWSLKLSGGIIPLPGHPLDWFGIAEIAYSVGGPVQSRELARAAAAHADELRESRRELPARIGRVRNDILARIAGTREELSLVDRELAGVAEVAKAQDRAETPQVQHARDTLALERVSVESDRVFLNAVLERLETLVGSHNGS